MQRTVLAGVIGVIFGTGIALSGMANPAKVLNFFDIAGTWDPSLAFVMGALCWSPPSAIAWCSTGPGRFAKQSSTSRPVASSTCH